MTTEPKPTVFVLAMMLALALGVGATLAITGCNDKPQPDPTADHAGAAAVLAVVFHKDGDEACASIQPRIESAKEAVGDRPIEFLTLDLGTDESRAASAEKAKSLGIEAIYNEHKDNVGFVLLIDMKEHKLIRQLTKDEDEAAWNAAFDGLAVPSPEPVPAEGEADPDGEPGDDGEADGETGAQG